MSLQLVSTYSGIDSFGNEVDLSTEDHSWITDKLATYARDNVKTLRNYMELSPDYDESALRSDSLESGYLLIYFYFYFYFYFSDWLELFEIEPDMDGDSYPCVVILPEEVGLQKVKVLAVLDTLPPIGQESLGWVWEIGWCRRWFGSFFRGN